MNKIIWNNKGKKAVITFETENFLGYWLGICPYKCRSEKNNEHLNHISQLIVTGGNRKPVVLLYINASWLLSAFLMLFYPTSFIFPLSRYFQGDNGEKITRAPIPDEFVELREQKFEELVGCLADVDEEIEELFLMEETPTAEQIHAAIRRTVITRKFQPVLLGSALKNKGLKFIFI